MLWSAQEASPLTPRPPTRVPAASYSGRPPPNTLVPPIRFPTMKSLREADRRNQRSEEHTSELQSRLHLVCRLLLEKKKNVARSVAARQKPDQGDFTPCLRGPDAQ